MPIKIKKAIIIVKVNKLYYEDMLNLELYEITRGIWRASYSRVQNVKFVFSVYSRIVKWVYKINSWHRALTTPYKTRTKDSIINVLSNPTAINGRYEFLSKTMATGEKFRNKYINQSVSYILKPNAVPYTVYKLLI